MSAARRVPLEQPPSKSDAAKVLRQQKELRERVGINLKAARTAAGLSLRAMQMRSDISANYLSELERGLRGATLDVLVQAAFHLNTTVADLIS
jgi:ribosome-binding protein aMBF1 (putative translation factor)